MRTRFTVPRCCCPDGLTAIPFNGRHFARYSSVVTFPAGSENIPWSDRGGPGGFGGVFYNWSYQDPSADIATFDYRMVTALNAAVPVNTYTTVIFEFTTGVSSGLESTLNYDLYVVDQADSFNMPATLTGGSIAWNQAASSWLPSGLLQTPNVAALANPVVNSGGYSGTLSLVIVPSTHTPGAMPEQSSATPPPLAIRNGLTPRAALTGT